MIGAKIPQWLVAAGLPTRLAGQVSFLIVAVLCALATLLSVTLSKNRAIDRGTLAQAEPGEGRFVRLSAIMQHARNNPRIMFVFLIGLVIRTDTSVVGAFLALWVINSAAESGIDAATATRTAGTLLTILSVASFATPPFFGYLADTINRVTLLLFGVVLTAVAFTSAIFVNDVTGWTIVFVVALIGFAEGAQTIAAQSMFGQEVPPHLRGSAMGVFAAMGTIMGLLITVIGGYLFDSVGYSAPFVLTGLLHFGCFAIAVAILASRARKAFVSGQPGNGPVASQGPRNADRTITPDDF